MSADAPRSRIDWNGEGNAPEIGRILKPGNLMRKAAAPAAIGLVGLALIGALAVGPVTRSLTTPDAGTVEVASVHTAQVPPVVVETASAQPAAESVAAVAPGTSTAARMTGGQTSNGLSANDPRWSADAFAVDESKLAELKKAVDETIAAVEIASAMGSDGTDVLFTSAMPTQAAGFAPERPVTSSRERSAFDAALAGASAEAEPAVASGLEPAKAAQYVNMRSAPADDASVVTVVPANAAIEAETDCRWCEVSYDGQKGYIFQSFITR